VQDRGRTAIKRCRAGRVSERDVLELRKQHLLGVAPAREGSTVQDDRLARGSAEREVAAQIREPRLAMPRPSSAATNRPTMSSTNARGVIPSFAAVVAMFMEYWSAPVRKYVSSPRMRWDRAMASAPTTSYSVCSPGRLLA